MQRSIAACLARCSARYPLGSVWRHDKLGQVVIAGHCIGHDGTPGTVVVSPDIVDAEGRVWSCYSPAIDLRRPS